MKEGRKNLAGEAAAAAALLSTPPFVLHAGGRMGKNGEAKREAVSNEGGMAFKEGRKNVKVGYQGRTEGKISRKEGRKEAMQYRKEHWKERRKEGSGGARVFAIHVTKEGRKRMGRATSGPVVITSSRNQ